MLKHYCGWQFRKWWPLLMIFAITSTLVILFAVLGNQMAITNTYTYAMPRTVSLLNILMPSIGATFVMPLFVFSYRTKKQSVDTYYQAAYAPNTIKRVRILLGLAIILAAFTIAYILGVAIYALRYAATPEMQVVETTRGDTYTRVRIYVNFLIYIPYFFVGIILLSAQYFINCFLVNLGDYTLDQVFLLLFGTLFLALLVIAPATYFAAQMLNFKDGFTALVHYGLSAIQPAILTSQVFDMLLAGIEINTPNLANSIAAGAIFVLFGAALAVLSMRMGDPSGEKADVRGARNNVIALIPHGAALTIGFFVGISGLISNGGSLANWFLTLPFFIFSMFGVIYYVLLALWRHNFKMSKFDLILFLSVLGFTLLLLFICITIPHPSTVLY